MEIATKIKLEKNWVLNIPGYAIEMEAEPLEALEVAIDRERYEMKRKLDKLVDRDKRLAAVGLQSGAILKQRQM